MSLLYRQDDDDTMTRKRAAFIARKAGTPPGVPPTVWTTFLDLYELLNEFAVFLIEVAILITLLLPDFLTVIQRCLLLM